MPFVDGKWVYEDPSIQNRVTGLLNTKNPLMQQAMTQGKQQASRMGLLNSSMGVQAGQAALYNVAVPIATQEASFAANQNQIGSNFHAQDLLSSQKFGYDTSLAAQQGMQNLEQIKTQGLLNSDQMKQKYGYDSSLAAQQGMQNLEQIKTQGLLNSDQMKQKYGYDSSLVTQQGGVNWNLAAQQGMQNLEQIKTQGLLNSNLTAQQAQYAKDAAQAGFGYAQRLEQQKMDLGTASQLAIAQAEKDKAMAIAGIQAKSNMAQYKGAAMDAASARYDNAYKEIQMAANLSADQRTKMLSDLMAMKNSEIGLINALWEGI
ncbi:MAG: hypothetical protein H7833_00465 [Magnetococcus sp. DMHC-1]